MPPAVLFPYEGALKRQAALLPRCGGCPCRFATAYYTAPAIVPQTSVAALRSTSESRRNWRAVTAGSSMVASRTRTHIGIGIGIRIRILTMGQPVLKGTARPLLKPSSMSPGGVASTCQAL